ncbi:restriction endonuclease [Flavobacterium jejuense]|uniref:Restriction endonuclease n=1 Tax=Flavobacterium jejuense TaxID=1544455 RepID=A0ABX0IN97_9FLAO|nr:restriction endonuclease [Flavobacterium jejuense]NHN25178.1 restriction endonuclease [Flavobacterium jejuense]
MNISYEEIKDGDHFEDLVAAYFRELKNSKENNITNVEVLQSGIGTDGGRDILIEFDLSDDIKIFKRKWIIQCKFHNDTISPAKIQTINIPTLIHSYKASGYLLVCKTNPTSGLTNLFERLNKECIYNYQYECWNGNQFLSKIYLKSNLHQVYFPKYNAYINALKNKS